MDVIHNVSLILNNNHFTTSSIRPYIPNVIDIGGAYVDPVVKPLPADIQKFLDSSPDGVILFSMGSIIKAVNWPVKKREAFVNVFSQLKQKVLWKYENETLPNKPENVMITKWLPQRDILNHKNIKLFITHGGLLSTTEAIFEGVKILGIPIFGDQKMNMKAAVNKGYAKLLGFTEINEKSLLKSIESALNDDKMEAKAKKISKLYKDRPMTAQESIVYWVEYVIRNNGALHLKSSATELNFIQLNNIDVYFTFIALFYSIIKITKIILTKIIKRKRDRKLKTK
jgi:hypothetical protein